MSQREMVFTAICPFCRTRHEHVILVNAENMRGKSLGDSHHFACCGHEIGFSVRRTLLADKIMEAGKP